MILRSIAGLLNGKFGIVEQSDIARFLHALHEEVAPALLADLQQADLFLAGDLQVAMLEGVG